MIKKLSLSLKSSVKAAPAESNQTIIKALRAKAGLTQVQCSVLLCVAKRTYERWEQGSRFCPNGMVKLARLVFKKEETSK